jgi:hypothetical protein
MQRTTRFEYLRCPNQHGRLMTFFDFLREKDFIRPLTPEQLEQLRRNLQSVNCSNCGAAVNLTTSSACAHCGSPLSMLDLTQAEKLVQQLQHAEDRTARPVDPSLPLELARARREVEAAFAGMRHGDGWFDGPSGAGHDGQGTATDLVSTGLQVMAQWLKGRV